MSIHGSHLDKLYHLRSRINDEIRIEEQRRGIKPGQPAKPKTRRAPSGPTVEQRIRDAGYTPHEVRAWAATQGLTTASRGRLSAAAFDAFKNAHQENADD